MVKTYSIESDKEGAIAVGIKNADDKCAVEGEPLKGFLKNCTYDLDGYDKIIIKRT